VVIFDLAPSPWLRADQQMVIGDALDASAVTDVVAGAEYVFNFAGIADIGEAAARPLDAVKTNVLANSIVLEAVRHHGVRRYLFASSVYVYSDAGSFYRASKQACELIIDAYAEEFGVEYTVLRYGSLYGPRSDPRNGIHRLVAAAVDDKKIVYAGSGDEMREFIHAHDAARLSLRALEQEFANQHLMLTGSQPIRMRDLLEMLCEIFGDVEVQYEEPTETLHYTITPYTFRPRLAQKVVSNVFVDLGQGLIDVAARLHDDER
jgi:UDP-glucose 4-epimerase